MPKKDLVLKKGEVLVMRSCDVNMCGYGGFKWPKNGAVVCPDWDPKPQCGNGLHGLLWGEGDGNLLSWNSDTRYLVISVLATDIVEIGKDKVKFPKGCVVFVGDAKSAAELIAQHAPKGTIITAGTATAGYAGTATAGVRGTATAGDAGTATAGYAGTATAGVRGTAMAGDAGTATAGYAGTATAGVRGTATAGDSGTATAGNAGTATAGDSGTATAGGNGIIILRYWDEVANREKLVVGYVGEDGIKPDTKYRLDNNHKMVKVK